ncbi:MAG: hypothetical protein K2K04_06330, partial [Clostridia bacterium]|nr:hypothetical protein [Clostridia bacterium]
LSLDGANSIEGLSIKLSGNIGTKAAPYVAKVAFTYNTNNYNAPEMADFNWEILKGTLDVSNAKWSYDEAFTYEFVNGKPVVYSVQIVDIPDYLKSKIVYTTNEESGNSASNAGEYTTSFTLLTIDTENYNAVVWPENLLESIDWEIQQKRLFTPEYQFAMGEDDVEEKVAWTFDNAAHNLLDLIDGIDESLSDYYTISVEYASDKVNFAAYNGYNGEKYDAIYAGIYKVVFAVKSTINGTVTNAVWGNGRSSNQIFRVVVDKATVTVTGWVEDAENSTVVLDDAKYASIINYIYRNEAERIIPIDYIYNSLGDETFYIEASVNDEFANSAELVYNSGVKEMISFVTEVPAEEPVRLEKPTIKDVTLEFNGSAQTVQITDFITNWSTYSDYLEIVVNESDSMTQTAVGNYKVKLRFNKDVNASWTTDSEGLIDRSTLTLSFSIKVKKIEIPTFGDVTYTGSRIEIAEDFIAQYGDYVTVVSGGYGTDVDTYKLILALNFRGNTLWNDDTFADKEIEWNITPAELDAPGIDATKQAALFFDGYSHSVSEVFDTTFNSDIMQVALEGSSGIDADTYTAKVTLNNSNYVWKNGQSEVEVTWKILQRVVTRPSLSASSKFTYDGEERNMIELLSNYNASLMVVSGTSFASDFGEYTVSIGLLSDNYVWDNKTTDPIEFKWNIEKRKLELPTNRKITYDGTAHDLLDECRIGDGWDTYLTVNVVYSEGDFEGFSATACGTYTLTFTIKNIYNQNADNVIWSDDTTGAVTVTVTISEGDHTHTWGVWETVSDPTCNATG